MDIHAVNAHLEVTSQDIAYFRRGELSPAVRERLEKAEKGCNRWLWIVFFVCIAIIVAVYVLARDDWTTIIAVSAAPAIFGIGALALLFFARNTTTGGEAAKVYSASGPAKLTVSYHEGNKRYALLVDKADFSIERDLFELIPEGAEITVYYQKLSARYNKLLGVASEA